METAMWTNLRNRLEHYVLARALCYEFNRLQGAALGQRLTVLIAGEFSVKQAQEIRQAMAAWLVQVATELRA